MDNFITAIFKVRESYIGKKYSMSLSIYVYVFCKLKLF